MIRFLALCLDPDGDKSGQLFQAIRDEALIYSLHHGFFEKQYSSIHCGVLVTPGSMFEIGINDYIQSSVLVYHI